jgi:endoglucanase
VPHWQASTGLNRRSACGLLFAGLAASAASKAIGSPLIARGPKVPTRGFNLPGWIDRVDGMAPTQQVLAKLGSLGFETVRLPVDPDLVGSADDSERAGILSKIEAAAGEAIKAGFKVIIDMHPAGDLSTSFANDPPGAARRVTLAWNYLSDVLASLPTDTVYAELLNEPPLERRDWLPLRDRLAAVVRSKCPSHTLIWGPSRYQGIWELDGTPTLSDANAIVAVHYYTPMGFTHQCENWDSSPLQRIADLPFPTERNAKVVEALAAKLRKAKDTEALTFLDNEFAGAWTAARIAADFADLGRWSLANRCPAMLNEFGVLNFCVDPKSRANWVRSVRQAAEANGAGWTYWEADQGFGFIKDRRSLEGFAPSMIEALLHD